MRKGKVLLLVSVLALGFISESVLALCHEGHHFAQKMESSQTASFTQEGCSICNVAQSASDTPSLLIQGCARLLLETAFLVVERWFLESNGLSSLGARGPPNFLS